MNKIILGDNLAELKKISDIAKLAATMSAYLSSEITTPLGGILSPCFLPYTYLYEITR